MFNPNPNPPPAEYAPEETVFRNLYPRKKGSLCPPWNDAACNYENHCSLSALTTLTALSLRPSRLRFGASSGTRKKDLHYERNRQRLHRNIA